jgi:hypothetical protein
MKILVIGGSSVAGQATIQAIRQFDGKALIVSTTSRDEAVAGADETIIGISSTDEGMHKLLAKQIAPHGNMDFMFYMPAYGKVGFPVMQSTREDAEVGMDFSFRPIVRVMESIEVGTAVGYTGFYWLPSLVMTYGALAFAKIAMEELALKMPDKFKVIRAGMFMSKSIRGISILLQRVMQKDLVDHPDFHAYKKNWKASGQKFMEFFADYAYDKEKAEFGSKFSTPFRATEPEDIMPSVARVLRKEQGPFFNVIGDWQWVEDKMPELPPLFGQMKTQLYPEGLK